MKISRPNNVDEGLPAFQTFRIIVSSPPPFTGQWTTTVQPVPVFVNSVGPTGHVR